MTTAEYREFVAMLRRQYPNAKKYQDRDTMNDWWGLVKKLDVNCLTEALRTFMQKSKFPPDVAELLLLVSDRARMADKGFVDENIAPPCMIVHKYGGDLDNPSGLTVGELIAKYYPCQECDGCERNQSQSCYGLIFGGGNHDQE